MKFKPNPNADTDGTSLQASADTAVTPKMMWRAFGEPHVESLEENKGYHDGEWLFTDENGESYAVYFRYGRCNIGAQNTNRKGALELVDWLKNETIDEG